MKTKKQILSKIKHIEKSKKKYLLSVYKLHSPHHDILEERACGYDGFIEALNWVLNDKK